MYSDNIEKFSLNLPKNPRETKVIVAMSGGVDSSTVAALLVELGYNVVGVTLQLYDHGLAIAKPGACCAGQDIYDAKNVSGKLGIPHYVLNYENRFKASVIDDFADSYIRGETPLPCVRCNQSVKFTDLIEVSKKLKADALVTGHYVRRIQGIDRTELHSAVDPKKDQSYFLFATTQNQLDYLHFPLGNISKEETRYHAKRLGIEIADKKDSQDICFVPNGRYADFVAKIRPNVNTEGKIMHVDGFEMGQHSGIINYTIGQRKGLGISYTEPLYVIKIDPKTNTVFVGPESALEKHEFIINDVNLLGDISEDQEFLVKVRSTHDGVYAKIKKHKDVNKMLIHMCQSHKAITPGQACVIYDNTRVMGGGWICS